MSGSLPSSPVSPADKTALRQRVRLLRGVLAAGAVRLLAGGLIDRLPAGAVVAGYWPLADELDVRPAMAALLRAGFVLALPVVGQANHPLLFRRWRPGVSLVEGPHGTSQPGESAPEVRPGCLLVPLLAFDRHGGRLGYGGGYYDRTLEALRHSGPPPLVVGIAYAAQEVSSVPMEPHDQPLDLVVTERDFIDISKR